MTLDLKKHLSRSGLRQTELADRLDISRSYMSLLTSGAREPSPALLAKMADVFGVSVGDLFVGQKKTGFSESSATPITAPSPHDIALLDLAKKNARHPILYRAKISAAAFGILSGDTLVVELRYTLRAGDIVIATTSNDQESGETGLFRWVDGILIDADPATNPVKDPAAQGIAILGLVTSVLRFR